MSSSHPQDIIIEEEDLAYGDLSENEPRRKSIIQIGAPIRGPKVPKINLGKLSKQYAIFGNKPKDAAPETDRKRQKHHSAEDKADKISQKMAGNRVEKFFRKLCSKKSLANLFFDYFLPVSQLVAIGQPFVHPRPGAYLSQFNIIGYILIAIIFLVLGLKLKTDDIKEAMKSSHVFIIAIISGLFISGSIVSGITSQIPFDAYKQVEKISVFGPNEFKIGCLLYYTVPCSITAGIVLVAQAEGNLPMAGAIATVANVIGCYTTPIMIKLYTTSIGDLKFDVGPILVKLTLAILVPVILGKVLQCIPIVPRIVGKFKRWISVITSLCLAIMLWMKVAKAVEDDSFAGVKWESLLFLIGFVLVMCAINISVNFFLSFMLCMKHPFIRVMILMVSQKTLVMAVTLVQVLPAEIGSVGLILVPCFVAHPTQILVFSLIAPQMRKYSFDFDCPEFVPSKIRNLCDWMNGNKRDKTGDVILSNPTVSNGEAIDLGLSSDDRQFTTRRRSSAKVKDIAAVIHQMEGGTVDADDSENKYRRRSSIKITDVLNGVLPGDVSD